MNFDRLRFVAERAELHVRPRLRQGSGEVSPKRFARRRKRVGEFEGRSPSRKS
jgi:hypothetical protein